MAAQLKEARQPRDLEPGVIINTIPALAWSARADGSAEIFSQQFVAYAGLPPEQLQGWGWTVAIHPSDLSALAGTWQSIAASGKPGEAEARLRRFDGEYRWFLFRANPMRDQSGSIVKWFAIGTDIEDRKRGKEALAALERDLRSIIDTIPTLAWSANPDGSADFVNQRWLDYTGMSTEQARGWGWRAAIHSEDVEGLVEHWLTCLASGRPLEAEARMRRFDGAHRCFLFRANPSHDEAGNISKWYGIIIDIDDRRRGEDALRESELSWRQIVDNIPGLVASTSAAGEVEFLNRQTLEYFGTTSEDLKNWALIGVVHPDDLPRVIEARKKSLETNQIYEVEHRCRRADGVFRWFQVRGLPVRDAQGTVTNWYPLLTDIEERKRAEDKLRRSEAFLSEGQRLSRTGSFSWCVETGEITWSEELYRIFEFDRSMSVTVELIGTRVYPDDILTFNSVIERACAGAGQFEVEHRLLMPDQSIKFLYVTAHGIQDEQGRLEYIGAVQDITARKRAEEALLESEKRHERVILSAKAGFWDWHVLKDEFYVSPSLLEMTAFPPGTTFASREDFMRRAPFYPEDRDKWHRAVKELFASGGSHLAMEVRSMIGGETIWARLDGMCFRDEAGRVVRWTGSATDVTERRRAEEALRLSEERYALAMEATEEAHFDWNVQTDEIFASERLRRVFDLQAETRLRMRSDVVSRIPYYPGDRERIREMTRDVLAGPALHHEYEYRLLRGQARELRWIRGRWKIIRDSQGVAQRVIGVVSDITERKRAEEARRALESNLAHMHRVSVMGELAASLAHEITQPIASARNNARAAQNFLEMQPLDLGEVGDALACVVGDVDRAGDIIDRIREQIKKAPPRKERFELNPAIDEVIVLARSAINRNSVSVRTRLADGLLPVLGDRVQLQQVLLNLILNSAEAMVSVEEGAREMVISTEQDQTGVFVAVRDSGPGIDAEHLERVFEAFYTTKPSGVGLGLSICRSIIDAHGGRLWAEANEPRGAVFQFTLPRAEVRS